jgi:hypothetical protein
MSFPTIPNVSVTINITTQGAINLLLASIAFEELGLAHIINSEAEKIQAVIGTLPNVHIPGVNLSNLIIIDETVEKVLKTVIKTQMLLEFKLEEVNNIPTTP